MKEFSFEVFSRRWSSTSTYSITWTEVGWNITHIAIGGDSDKEGKPHLYENFHQDLICYPSKLDGYMEYLWEQIEEKKISPDEAQTKIQQLADWVSKCEKGTPLWEGWNV